MSLPEQLSVLNEEYKILPGAQSLHNLIRWNRDTCALDFLLNNDGQRIKYTYYDLRRCVLSTASALQAIWAQKSKGQRTHRIIPVLLPQSPALYVTILAVLETGAAFCPINLDAPIDRIKFVVEDVSAEVVVTCHEYENLFKWSGGPNVLLIDDAPSVPNGESELESNASTSTLPHDLAYVMYTSGSTGTPKGVAISHLAVSQSLLAHERHIPSFNRFLQFASPSFDVSVFEIFFPLLRGATLVGCRRPHMLNDLIGVINKLDVDALELTPTVVSSLLRKKSNVPGVKLLLTIGEMLTRPVVDSFGDSENQDGILYAMYGPTETAIHCTINPKMETQSGVTNIGFPLDTVSAFVVAFDDTNVAAAKLSLLPIGQLGELVIGGPQLAVEYLNRREQNENAFINIRGQRTYRTGDRARIKPDGTIEILGRISSGQVKIRGQRVELGEIEDAIYRHPHVKIASTSIIHGMLVAFVLAKNVQLTTENVLEACSTWLPSFMIPSEFVILDVFPYLPSGKVDRKKLEADFESQRTHRNNEKAQWDSPAEQIIGKVIQDLLGVSLSINARLATYGLDSLVAIRVGSVLRSAGYHVWPIEILKADDLQSLASICENSIGNRDGKAPTSGHLGSDFDTKQIPEIEGIDQGEVEYTMPCMPVQDAMLSETAVDGLAYKNVIVIEVTASLSIEQLIEALQVLIQNNSILRTGFIESPGDGSTFLQVVWKGLPSSQVEVVRYSAGKTVKLQQISILNPFHIQIRRFDNRNQILLQIHHSLYDAWSVELILDDLETILQGNRLQNRPSFRNVVKEYFSSSEGRDMWASKVYWRDYLSLFDVVHMPNFNAVVNKERALDTTTFQTSIATQDLESVARTLGVSPQSVFQTAYALILSSYLGTKDVCFGTVFSGRTNSIIGIEDIIGPCLSTLPVRADLTIASTMADLTRALNTTNRKHLEHGWLPLKEIKKACGVDPGQPLYDSLLVWQQTLHKYDHKRDYVKLVNSDDYLEFSLTLEISPTVGNIIIKANYQRSVFPMQQIDLLLRQLDQLVGFIISTPESPILIRDDMLSDDLLSIENINPVVTLNPGSLTSSVELMAINFPDKCAIEFADSIDNDRYNVMRISYAELNAQANRIAHYLISQNVHSDELVCVFMEKSAELYISILATCKAGAGYVPLTPDTPRDRLQHIISSAKVSLVLTHSSVIARIDTVQSVQYILVDKLDFSALSSKNPLLKFETDSLAYCVFTSGSTGIPKGVLVTQGNLLSNLQILAELYPYSYQSKFLQSCSQAFDVSVFEIFFAWHVGACLCSAVKDVMFRDIELVIRVMEITHLSLTPTVAALVCPENILRVEFLVTAGEAVTNKVFNTWANRGLYQGYGPSETTNICTVRPNVTKYHAINNIGPPLKNTSVFVVSSNEHFTLIPRGGKGEFCFGGAQVGRGYLDPLQTVGKFIEHPIYGRLYRSGDYGRLLSDGSLTYIERKDDQVKLRGQRIELGEINNVLLKSPDVTNCMNLIIEESKETDQRLVCFWTPTGSTAIDFVCLKPSPSVTKGLFRSLARALPTYMIPSILIPVSCIPSTTQGKVDKKRLVSHFRSLDLSYIKQVYNTEKVESDYIWTTLEQKIATSVSETVQVVLSDIGPDTSFFSLGIDSMSAISLSRVLREKENIRVEISDILKHASVTRLASRIAQTTPPNNDVASSDSSIFNFDPTFIAATVADFEKAGRLVERILPCTPLQDAMLSAAETSSDAYKNRLVLEVKVDIAVILRVWAEMIRRHEILRICFVRIRHPRFAYVQVVLKDFSPEWEVIDADGAAFNQQDMAIREGRTEFDPPYSLHFVRSHGTLKLVLSMNHAIYDGFEISILFEEMENSLLNIGLHASVSFVPFLRYMSSLDLMRADEYWSKLLMNYFPNRVPQSMQISDDSKSRQTSVLRMSSKSKLSWVNTQIKTYDTSLLSVFQTLWASALCTLLNEVDICFGNVVSCRTVPVKNIEKLVAPCFNTIPVRIKNMDRLTYIEVFRVFQSQNAESLPFQLTPLRRIQARWGGKGERIFQTLFILQKPLKMLNPSIWSIVEENGAMDLPLVFEVVPDREADRIELILHTHRTYISDREAEDLLDTLDERLKVALENPRHPIISGSRVAALSRPGKKLGRKSDSTRQSENHEPLNKLEIAIRDILSRFSDFLKEDIQRNTTIFRLGLDSISSVHVAADLRKQGHMVMASDVLQHPSVGQLAIHLERREKLQKNDIETYDFQSFEQKYREYICSKLKRAPETIETIRPCTPVQCGMLARSLHENGREYVNSICLELIHGASLTKIHSAWKSCVRRIEMLRTGFVEVDDQSSPFAMVTYKADTFSLPWTTHERRVSEKNSLDLDRQYIMDSLSTCPWGLNVFENGSAALLKFTAHHAIYDAHSLELILVDVARNYTENFEPSSMSQPPVNSILGAILTARNRDEVSRKRFWQEENKTCISRFPDLNPLRQTAPGTGFEEKISSLSKAQLEKLSRNQDISIQAAGQAAWARLLSSYVGEPSVTFGLTLSGRAIHESSDKYAFPTIVTLPVSCDVEGANSDLLRRIMISNSRLHEHQFTPLTSIQKWVGHPEGKLFDTLFAYQKINDNEAVVERPWKIVREEATADYTVSMELQLNGDGALKLRLTFNESLIPAEQARVILDQYDALLSDTLQNTEALSNAVPHVSRKLLSITPAAQPILPSPVKLLHEFVEMQTQNIPQKIAFEFTTRQSTGDLDTMAWNFAQLDIEGNKIANLLLKCGASNGDLVAICFNKCPEASFVILGILKAGCAYVALDPNAPPDRLKFIMEDSRSSLIISTGELAQTLFHVFEGSLAKNTTIKVLNVGNSRLLRNIKSGRPTLTRPVEPQDTCYCLYTSGTTGRPKGCEITHENAVQAMMSFQKLFQNHWTEDSKWLQFASFHFDVSVLEQFWSWSVGICVASAPRDLIFEDIPGMIRELGITHIDLTPSLAHLLDPKDAPSLTKGVFITGGEQLRQEILDAWGGYECIYNGYGPTEATIGVTMYPRVPKNGKPSNIGPQFQNVGSYVLKLGTAKPVLRGAIGELCVSGKLLGKGYLNRPELTKERFPYLDDFGERVYRTGDLVRILHDGSFLFLGRADDQVKLRGQRLELNEINETIKKEMGNIQDVISLVLKHINQQKEQLVTFFVPSPFGDAADSKTKLPHSMRAVCNGRLPGYMVPTYFIALEKLPLSANNKADMKELGRVFDSMSISELQSLVSLSRPIKNWTDKQKSVLKILAKNLKVEMAILEQASNIFELGIDSILVIGLARSLQRDGLKNASLSAIMRNSSIDSLVHILASDEKDDDNRSAIFLDASQRILAFNHKYKLSIADELGINASGIERLAPATPTQEGMVYRFLGSDSALYFTTFNYVLEGALDEARLLEAWRKAASRLQVLRTKFVLTNDGCAQVVMKKPDLPLRTISIERTSEEVTMQNIRDLQSEMSKANKIAALTSPCKISIIHSKTKRFMSLEVFHGLYDGISLQLLLRKVREEYQNNPSIDYGPPFHTVLPYGPLARIKYAEGFWRDELRNHEYHAVPRLRRSPVLQNSGDASVTRKIAAIDIQHLLTIRATLGITHQTILLAAWSSVLAGILNPSLVPSFAMTQGLVLSGRSFSFPPTVESSITDPQDTIGPLFNTVPFHVNITKGMSWDELLRKCHIMCTKIVGDGLVHTPLRDVLQWCGGTGENKVVDFNMQRELFDTLFVFQHEGHPEEEESPRLWRALPVAAIADYPLAFEAQLNNNGDIILTLAGQASVLDDAAATDVLTKVEKALGEIEDPKRLVTNLETEDRSHEYQSIVSANQLKSQSQPTTGRFAWTHEAHALKAEIELLSGIKEIDEHSPIFSLGLDSIDIIKLVSRLRKHGVQISVSTILKSQSIANMVDNISNAQILVETNTITMIDYEQRLTRHLQNKGMLPECTVAVLPATPLQEGMVVEMISSGYTRYFNHEVFRVPSHVDINKLMEAWDSVILKNDILRTRFLEIDDVDLPMSFAQVVYQPAATYWHKLEISASSNLQDKVLKAIQNAMKIAKDEGLLQLQSINHEGNEYFVLSVAHALYDGRSLRLLHQDILAAYRDNLSSRPGPEPTLQLIFNTENSEAAKFWTTHLNGLHQSKFPLEAGISNTITGAVHRRQRISSHALGKVQEFCRSISVNLQTLGESGWAILLATYLKQLDIVFGVVLSCRDTEEASEIMFPLMNTVAVRSVLHGSLRELLIYMQETANSIRQFQHFPLRKAQALAGIQDGNLFDTLFIYQGRASQLISENDKLYDSIENVAEVEFAVCVEMEIIDDQLVWRTAVKDSILNGLEADSLLQLLDEVVGRMIEHPEMPTISSNPEGISICGLNRFIQENSRANTGVPRPVSDLSRKQWTSTETQIRKVLSQVSKIPEEEIDRYQTIFHLGLDSISAIKVSSILRKEGIKLSVNDIVKQGTIANMANILENGNRRIARGNYDVDKIITDVMKGINQEYLIRMTAVDPEIIQEILPVTAGQLYMLARWQASVGALFVGTFEYRINGKLDAPRLEGAWKALVQKHSILRTAFVILDWAKASAAQVILKDIENCIRWRSDSTSDSAITLRSPLSLSVSRCGGDTLLCLRIHHALYDGVSLPLLIRDLQAFYAKSHQNDISNVEYRKFVALSCNRDDKIIPRRMKFWKSFLNKSTLLSSKDIDISDKGSRVEVFEPDNRIGEVPSLAQRNGVSIDAILLAAFARVYCDILNAREKIHTDSSEDVVFGIYLANRAVYDEDLSSLAAPTLNLLPIRISPVGSVAQIARTVQSNLQNLSSAEIAGTSLAEIYEWTGVHVDCFINILKPFESDAALQEASDRFLEETEDVRRKRRAEIVEVQTSLGLDGIPVVRSPSMYHPAYLPSLDVEMRVIDGGAGLDIGVFTPLEYMKLEDAVGLVQKVAAQLHRIE